LAYALATDVADDGTPERDQDNEQTDQRRRAMKYINDQGLSGIFIGLGVLLIVLGASLGRTEIP
jgi:hypothetical protein